MSCKNLTEALLEDVIEITWMFDGLVQSGKIKSWDEICEQEYGSDGIKATIKNIAQEFEVKYPFETTWEDSNLDYIEEIEKFAKEELIREYRKTEDEPDMIDGITTCCGYDFGFDASKAKFCPVCGKKLMIVESTPFSGGKLYVQ